MVGESTALGECRFHPSTARRREKSRGPSLSGPRARLPAIQNETEPAHRATISSRADGTIVRKLAYILPLLLSVAPLSAVTKKIVKKKPTHATHFARRYRPPKVYVSPMMQRMAFEAVS